MAIKFLCRQNTGVFPHAHLTEYLNDFEVAGITYDAAMKIFSDDIVIIDTQHFRQDVLSVIRKIRDNFQAGIIVLSESNDPVDRILALEYGADEVLEQPYISRELSARVRNIHRWISEVKRGPGTGDKDNDHSLCFSGWSLCLSSRQLTSPNKTRLLLPKNEFLLLEGFLKNSNKVMSRDELLRIMYKRSWSPSDRIIDLVICRLRKKLTDSRHQNAFIETVYGQGYMFRVG